MGLTDKKRRFVDALRSGVTGAKAAILAGYSDKGAAQAASRLMKDKAVAAALGKGPAVNKSEPGKKEKANRFAPPPAAGFTAADGTRSPAAPAGWPFGVEPPAAPPPPPEPPADRFADPRDYLMFVMNDFGAEPKERLEAAKALLPFEHSRLAPKGKKDTQKDAAGKASGRFAPAEPPKLVVNNRT
ncbi:terminase [Pigmentiphaga litoralis]|uniref:terminase small subunit n=1 Tax=Pigmentiphaga litoralis TaxID=516702 RepID=UPI001672B973|nr:terminase small subunit [Pigmentiphaga litoralis]GGX11212.1 terminase [Pigmentiphaga litoralis]